MSTPVSRPTEEDLRMANRTGGSRMTPLGAFTGALLALGIGTGIVAAVVTMMLPGAPPVYIAACCVALMAWGVWIARSHDSEIRQVTEPFRDNGENAPQGKESRSMPTAKPPLYRQVLRLLAATIMAPINVYRVPMPSDEQMGLTPVAERQFRGPAEEALAAEVRMACAKATARAAERDRMRDSNFMDQEIARVIRDAASYQADADWLALAYNRLAAGSTSAEQVRADWERRRAL